MEQWISILPRRVSRASSSLCSRWAGRRQSWSGSNMDPAQAGMKFFVLSGVILILSGVAQALARPRGARERGVQRYFNGATARAMVFVTVGVLAIMVGLGAIPIGMR